MESYNRLELEDFDIDIDPDLEFVGESSPEEQDDDSMSSPSSPVLGYSRARDPVVSAAADSESEGLLFCFACKGTPKPFSSGVRDTSFSPDGLILRHQLLTTLALLRGQDSATDSQEDEADLDSGLVDSSASHPSGAGRFFGETLDPLDPRDARLLLNLARKNIHILQILANPRSRVWEEEEDQEEDGPAAGGPWQLRKEVVTYFNVLVARVGTLKGSLWGSVDELDKFFGSFKEAFGRVGPGWGSYLKGFTGNRNGNECSSPLYHLFHVMLELRWGLLVVYGMNSEVLAEVLEDLIQLAWVMWGKEGSSSSGSYLSRQPFNCWCVKELWTMIRLLCEELGINFWTAVTESLKKGWTESVQNSVSNQNEERGIFFPLWLTCHLAALGDYGLNGVWTPGRELKEPESGESSKFNGYSLVNNLVKAWISRGSSSKSGCEVYQMLLRLTPFWGCDLELLLQLWGTWFPKMEKTWDGAGSLENYSTVEKWSKLIQSLASSQDDQRSSGNPRPSWPPSELDNFIGRDPFLSFLKLLLAHGVLLQGTGRDWKRLKSRLGMNLDKNTVGNWGETGLLRVSTMYLSLAWATGESHAMCDRLKELLAYGKQGPVRIKTVLRACSTGIYLLLQKSLDISSSSLTSHLMSSITNVLSQSPLDSGRKDNVMIYLELLDTLPKTPAFNEELSLGRDTLISPNLTMWLSNCGANYVVRTLRVLYSLTNWIISCKREASSSKSAEREAMITKIFDRTTGFLSTAVILNVNRVPNTDVEPMARLGADLTLFSKWSQASGPDSLVRLYDHFALNDRTCPEVSQHYVARLLSPIHHEALLGSGGSSSIPFIKWCQTWIRLNAVDASIPESLTELVLGSGFSSTSNSDLLSHLCSTTSREWSRMDVHNTLSPLSNLIKGVFGPGGVFKEAPTARIVSGIVRACTQTLVEMEWGKIYIKNDPGCVGMVLLSAMIPPFVGTPPWERLPKHVLSALKPCLFDIFKAITSSPGFGTDAFLLRKVQDLVTFAILGYVEPLSSNELDEVEESPATKIMIYSEDHEISAVLSTSIPALSGMMTNSKSDSKLHSRFVAAVVSLKNSRLTTTVRRFLPGILSIYVNAVPNSELGSACLSVILYCAAFGGTPLHGDAILAAFDSGMESSFAFKSRRWWDLAGALVKCSRVQVKKFLKIGLLPLFQAHVRASEQRRGTGTDMSLRNPLEKLEREAASL